MPYSSVTDQRASAKRYYERNTEISKARALAHKNIARQRNRAYVTNIKNVPCADCNVHYPHYVMQFDHITGVKDKDIAIMMYAPVSLERLQKEIEKCQIVCANCHAIRTWERSHSDTQVR